MTGTIPHQRSHVYWELEAPCTDLGGAWREKQSGIATALNGDKVIDAPRIMRLAGTINYPSKTKMEKGYKPEIVKFVDGSGVPITIASSVPTVAPEPKVDPGKPIKLPDARKVQAALARLDPDFDYNEWIKFGAGLYHSFGRRQEGLDLWTEWSARGKKFVPGECGEKWKTFANYRGGRFATVASIFAAVKAIDLEAAREPHTGWLAPSDVWEIKAYVSSDIADCFPPIIERFARAESERIGADAMTIGAMTLPVASSCLHSGWYVYPKTSEKQYKEPLITWVIAAMDPGQRKSAIFDSVLKPLNSMERKWGKDFLNEDFVYVTTNETRKEEDKLMTKEMRKGEDRKPPEKPKMKRIIVDDGTVEAIGVFLSGSGGSVPVSGKGCSGWRRLQHSSKAWTDTKRAKAASAGTT